MKSINLRKWMGGLTGVLTVGAGLVVLVVTIGWLSGVRSEFDAATRDVQVTLADEARARQAESPSPAKKTVASR